MRCDYNETINTLSITYTSKNVNTENSKTRTHNFISIVLRVSLIKKQIRNAIDAKRYNWRQTESRRILFRSPMTLDTATSNRTRGWRRNITTQPTNNPKKETKRLFDGEFQHIVRGVSNTKKDSWEHKTRNKIA